MSEEAIKNEPWFSEEDDKIFAKFELVDGKYLPPMEIFQKHLDQFSNNQAFSLEWKCIGRRPPTPENAEAMEAEEDQFAEMENTLDDGDFEFEDELNQLNLSAVRSRNATPKGSAKKMKTTSLQSILSNIARHRKLDMLAVDEGEDDFSNVAGTLPAQNTLQISTQDQQNTFVEQEDSNTQHSLDTQPSKQCSETQSQDDILSQDSQTLLQTSPPQTEQSQSLSSETSLQQMSQDETQQGIFESGSEGMHPHEQNSDTNPDLSHHSTVSDTSAIQNEQKSLEKTNLFQHQPTEHFPEVFKGPLAVETNKIESDSNSSIDNKVEYHADNVQPSAQVKPVTTTQSITSILRQQTHILQSHLTQRALNAQIQNQSTTHSPQGITEPNPMANDAARSDLRELDHLSAVSVQSENSNSEEPKQDSSTSTGMAMEE